jgi:PKD repeat protein
MTLHFKSIKKVFKSLHKAKNATYGTGFKEASSSTRFFVFSFLCSFVSSFLLAIFLVSTPLVHAQELESGEIQSISSLKAVISSDNAIRVGKKALFDASASILLDIAEKAPIYTWNFGDSTRTETGKEVLHDYKEPGKYKITLNITHQGEESSIEKEVFIYTKKLLLLTDNDKRKELSLITDQAAEQGVLINLLSPREEATSEFLAEEDFIQKFTEEPTLLNDTNAILFYTRNARGLQAFNRYFLNLEPEKQEELRSKFIIRITDGSLTIDTEIANRSFNIIKPKNILITRKEALNPIFETENQTSAVSQLISRAIEFEIIDERSGRSFIFFLSSIVSNFVARGVPSNMLHLVLAFPFIALIITFARQIVGILTFGVFIPAMLSVAFLILGIDFGLIVVFIIIAMSYLLRRLINKIELLYIPRVSLLLSCISLSLLLAIWFQLTFKSSIPVSLSIFPMLFMSTISEKFLSAQTEEGTRQAFIGVFQTIVVSIIAYYTVANDYMSQLIVSIPEIVIFPLILIFLLGRFTGLRITEYLRFKSILKGGEGIEE